MNQFGDLYSQYYDLLYNNKDYKGEVEYVDNLIKEHNKSASTILDLGCGTGRHAELFCEKGYKVHGVDISDEMLKRAGNRRCGKEDKLTFSQADITKLSLDQKFDVVVSLFHVMSYQTTNERISEVFAVAKKHLNKNGLFIFDFWYGPAVLTDLPVTRIKRLNNSNIKITRMAEPIILPEANVVEVNYDVLITELATGKQVEKQECHRMRYLFTPELDKNCNDFGFNSCVRYKWLSHNSPDFGSWYVVWVLKL